jgi:hypothetical protein
LVKAHDLIEVFRQGVATNPFGKREMKRIAYKVVGKLRDEKIVKIAQRIVYVTIKLRVFDKIRIFHVGPLPGHEP